jgi:hypothetical protein
VDFPPAFYRNDDKLMQKAVLYWQSQRIHPAKACTSSWAGAAPPLLSGGAEETLASR